MAANMVSAYYDRTVDAAAEFAGLAISTDPSFEKERNRYDAVRINMQDFLGETCDMGELISRLQSFVCRELETAYPDVNLLDRRRLPPTMADIFSQTGRQFVIVIDE